MKNEEKIVELLTESLKGQDPIVAELKGTNQELKGTNQRLDRLDKRVENLDKRVENLDKQVENLDKRAEKIEGHLVKLNLQTAENTRAIFQLAEKVEQIADLHNRVTKLEKTVYK